MHSTAQVCWSLISYPLHQSWTASHHRYRWHRSIQRNHSESLTYQSRGKCVVPFICEAIRPPGYVSQRGERPTSRIIEHQRPIPTLPHIHKHRIPSSSLKPGPTHLGARQGPYFLFLGASTPGRITESIILILESRRKGCHLFNVSWEEGMGFPSHLPFWLLVRYCMVTNSTVWRNDSALVDIRSIWVCTEYKHDKGRSDLTRGWISRQEYRPGMMAREGGSEDDGYLRIHSHVHAL